MRLGDLVFHITRFTGIKYLVDLYHKKNWQKMQVR